MKLQLPFVTLVIVETQLHKLAAMAAKDCLAAADFGDVLIASDDFTEFTFPARHHVVEDWPTKLGMQRFVYSGLCYPLVKTEYQLLIEWDSWVVNPAAWTDEFLEYDFVGAPWGYADGLNVGNGGFSLRSTRLIQYLHDHSEPFKFDSSRADDLLCRNFRTRLMRSGFKWAPEELAHRFAFERYPNLDQFPRPFGFHGMFNWGVVLNRESLIERMLIAKNYPYVVNDACMWEALIEQDPTLIKEL